jgi:hypothetical protein
MIIYLVVDLDLALNELAGKNARRAMIMSFRGSMTA